MTTIRSGERCPTCKRRIKRSSESNRRYWALLHAMAEKLRPADKTYSADTWHLWAKSKFLGSVDYVLPSGRIHTVANSTAELDTAEFAEYMDKLEAWANEHDVYLEDMEA